MLTGQTLVRLHRSTYCNIILESYDFTEPTEMHVDNQSSNKTVTERPVSSTEQVVLSTHSVKTITRHLTTLQYTTIGEDFDGQGTGVTASEPTPLTEEAIDMAATIGQ